MRRLAITLAALLFCRCHEDPQTRRALEAAQRFSNQYANQDLKASVAGSDCLVLLIRSHTRLNDTAVETIHYGIGSFTAYKGGAAQFADDEKFRAVVYRDGSGKLWTYGSTTIDEAQSLPSCR